MDSWPTKQRDLDKARQIMNTYADNEEMLGIFELYTSGDNTKFQLSEWVLVLVDYFRKCYGNTLGDNITRRVVTTFLVNGETIH